MTKKVKKKIRPIAKKFVTDGDTFYHQYKDALKQLGLEWNDKHQMRVELIKNKIVFTREPVVKSVTVDLSDLQ